MEAATEFIKEIQKISKSSEFQTRHTVKPEKNFIRQRKLSFSDVIMYTIGNSRGTIGLNAERFTKYIKEEEISSAAVCKSRKKVQYTAFQELFEKTAETAPRDKKFHGCNIIAVDGMKGELPKTPELTEKYSVSPQSDIPIFHSVAAYDVLNEIFISSQFHFGNANERELACDMLEDIMQKEAYKTQSQIWVFDRGFPSLFLIQKLLEYNQQFVMRVSRSFLKEVNEFRESKYVDREIHISCSKQRTTANHVKSDGVCEFDLRCVRIQLKSEEEILITNLDRKDFPKRDIKEIYRLRWGIETSFNYLKNSIFVEEFTTRSENGLKQEYYASLIMYNFSTCICGSLYNDIPKKESINTK